MDAARDTAKASPRKRAFPSRGRVVNINIPARAWEKSVPRGKALGPKAL
jgi:hypothetical protein